jgi:hypothetical protein
MIRVIADAALQSTFEGITETIELRGEHGELLGFFSPASPETAKFYADAAMSITRDDIARRQQMAHATYSTAEVLSHLRNAGRQ